MEDVLISGVTLNKNEAKITLCGVPDKPGVAVKLFKDLATSGVSVDMIVQNVSHTRWTDISFTIAKTDCAKASKIAKMVAKKIGAGDVLLDEDIARVSIVGVGMKSHHGVAARMFGILADNKINIETVPLDDANTYKLLASSHSIGIFQVESSGMRDLLKKLVPERFEDLIALLALYRPGPIGSGMLDDFMKRKHGLTPIKYEHPRLEPILKETYGIMVYQEQIMQIASALAGFTLAQADILRKAMGKKIPEVMEKERSNFINGCIKNSIREVLVKPPVPLSM